MNQQKNHVKLTLFSQLDSDTFVIGTFRTGELEHMANAHINWYESPSVCRLQSYAAFGHELGKQTQAEKSLVYFMHEHHTMGAFWERLPILLKLHRVIVENRLPLDVEKLQNDFTGAGILPLGYADARQNPDALLKLNAKLRPNSGNSFSGKGHQWTQNNPTTLMTVIEIE